MFSFLLIRAFCKITREKQYRPAQATDDNMEHAHRMLNTQVYAHKRTPRICNTYCFSTETMVAPRQLIVTFYIPCLSGHLMHISYRTVIACLMPGSSYWIRYKTELNSIQCICVSARNQGLEILQLIGDVDSKGVGTYLLPADVFST